MSELRMFHWADYVVFCLMLLVSAAIGVYYGIAGRRHQNTEEFLMGGRDLQVLPVVLSIKASFISAVYILGLPVEVYYFGATYALIILGYSIAYAFAAEFIIPKLHKLQLTSAYEIYTFHKPQDFINKYYLEMRFSRTVRTVASLTFIIMTTLYMGMALYAPALAFSQVTGMSMLVTIVGIGVICTFYTSLGGMRAVVWTDTVQMLVMFGGLLALIIQGSIGSGGLISAVKLSAREARLNFFKFSPDPTERITFWTQSLGAAFLILNTTVNQTTLQRYMSIKSSRDARKAAYIVLLISGVSVVLMILVGIVMYAYYHGCDPLQNKQIRKADQMVPLFMMDVLGQYPGLPGLFTACTFSAALSTVSSGVNALAAVLLEDIIKPLYLRLHRQPLTERAATNASRGMAVVFGLLTIMLGYLAQYLSDTIVRITVGLLGMAGGPLLGLFVLALFVPCANSKGALAGVAASFVTSFWVGIGAVLSPGPKPFLPVSTDFCNVSMVTSNVTGASGMIGSSPSTVVMETVTSVLTSAEPERNALQALYNTSFMWYSLLAVLVSIGVGVPVSLLTGGRQQTPVDSSLVVTFTNSCCRQPHNKVDSHTQAKYMTKHGMDERVEYKDSDATTESKL